MVLFGTKLNDYYAVSLLIRNSYLAVPGVLPPTDMYSLTPDNYVADISILEEFKFL
jgi:hypothetical protein